MAQATRLLKKLKRQHPDERPAQHWARAYLLVIPGYAEMTDVKRRDAVPSCGNARGGGGG